MRKISNESSCLLSINSNNDRSYSKRDFTRDNPWPAIPVPRYRGRVYRPALSRIHGWIVGCFRRAARSSLAYECAKKWTDASIVTHSVCICRAEPPHFRHDSKAQRRNKSDERRRCTRSFVSRNKMRGETHACRISNRGFRFQPLNRFSRNFERSWVYRSFGPLSMFRTSMLKKNFKWN